MLEDPIGSLLEAANTFFEDGVTPYDQTPLAEALPAPPPPLQPQPAPYDPRPYSAAPYLPPPSGREPVYLPPAQPTPANDAGPPSLEDYVAAGSG
jgi:hypothetical protein